MFLAVLAWALALLMGGAAAYIALYAYLESRWTRDGRGGHATKKMMTVEDLVVAAGPYPADYQAEHTICAAVIGALWVDGELPARAAVEAKLREVVARPELARLCTVPLAAEGCWSAAMDAAQLDWAWHVREAAEPVADEGAVRERACSLPAYTEAFDLQRPWWFFELVRVREGRSAVMLRLHHAYADGLAILELCKALLLTDAAGTKPLEMPRFKRRAQHAGPRRSALSLVWEAVRSVGVALSAPMCRFDDPSPLDHQHARYTGRRRWLETRLDLEDVKRVKNGTSYGATVNDVIVSLVAGAIHRFLHEGGRPGLMRAVLPFALPRTYADGQNRLENKFVYATVRLPVRVAGARPRLRQTHDEIQRYKESLEFPVMSFVQARVGRLLPATAAFDTALKSFMRRTLHISNVPGPSSPVFLCGKRVDQIGFQVPFPKTAFFCVSYAGRVSVNLMVDDRMPGLEGNDIAALLHTHLHDELRELLEEQE